MAAHTVVLMWKGGVEGGYRKSYTAKLTQKLVPPLLWPCLNAFSSGNEVHHCQLLGVYTHYVRLVTQRIKHEAQESACWGNQQQAQPLPPGGSPPLHSGGQNQRWPTSGQGGYITPTAWGVPTASERGGQNQRWPTSGQGGYITPAAWGVPTASQQGGRIRSGPQVGEVAT